VLINALRAGSSGAAARADLDCSFEATAEAYELTGDRERDLEPFVGRVVQINGMLKEADTEPVGTSGASQPTGGIDPLGQDLQLFEVNVTSFQEVTAAAAQAPSPAAPDAQSIGTAGTEDQLPRTASPLPIAGILGLLSLGGAFGLRALRRR
jgi:hypothetical protein